MRLTVYVATCVYFCLFLNDVHAEKMYVSSDTIKITLRTGPGIDRKVIAMLASGQEVELITPGDDWSRVRLADSEEKEGWVLTRFLSGDMPNALELELAREKLKKMTARLSDLEGQIEQLKTENQRLVTTSPVADSSPTEKDDELLNLKNANSHLKKQLSIETRKIDKLQEELAYLKNNERIKWASVGVAILLIGIIIGKLSKDRRRKSSLLS